MLDNPKNTFSWRLAEVRSRIVAACRRCGRDPGEVTLVAVSKTFPFDRIVEARAAGQIDFGENYMQDCLDKIAQAEARGLDCRWHFIGHLQRNKARFLDHRFALFHGLDNLVLARRLNHFAELGNYRVPVLVQVNIASEATKSGVDPAGLFAFLEQLRYNEQLDVQGLMTIPPAGNPEAVRPWFAALRELFDKARERFFRNDPAFRHLSMGMSGDFEVAIEEGATLVRVGTLLFGPRG
jgi:pyridoxal phosphate enzyme (YggS family)